MTCCAGLSAWDTSTPRARSLTALMKARTTGRATSASSSAMRISRAVASMSASVSLPLPRRPVKTLSRRSERGSNTARPQKVTGARRVAPSDSEGTAPLGPSSGRVPQPEHVDDDGHVADHEGGAAVHAQPLGALSAVVGVPVDARRLLEL